MTASSPGQPRVTGSGKPLVDDVERQIADELDRALAGPVSSLMGMDLGEMVRRRLGERARMLAGQLSQDTDDRLAAETVIDLMGCLWPHMSPEECGQADWWRTPLGRLCARSLGRDDAEAVTRHVAAAMLGVSPGTVAQLVARGSLDRHPDGGITRASVMARLVRLHPPET